ncbi:MAG: hypothetical protein ACOYB3_01440 [Azonexus sp.]
MDKETEQGLPDNPDPYEKLKQEIVACAEKQKGYDISARLKDAPLELLKRMKNKPLAMMRALLEEWHL